MARGECAPSLRKPDLRWDRRRVGGPEAERWGHPGGEVWGVRETEV